MSVVSQSFDFARIVERLKSAADWKQRAAMATLATGSCLLPVTSGYYNLWLFDVLSPAAAYLFVASTVAALVAPVIEPLREHVRKFDLAAGAVAAFLVLGLLLPAALGLGTALQATIGMAILLAALCLGLLRGVSVIQYPVHV